MAAGVAAPDTRMNSGDEGARARARQQTMDLLTALLQPWHTAVEAPAPAQRRVLAALLKGYAATEYGRWRGASGLDDLPGFRQAFPVMGYEEYRPLIRRVMGGETGVLLGEDPPISA